MTKENVRRVMTYYVGTAEMLQLLRNEREELEDCYGVLKSPNLDGMPHGSAPGSPVERQAIKNAQNGTMERLQEIYVKIQVIEADAGIIRGCFDTINGRYKRILKMRFSYKYSWVQIGVRLGVPESTARSWYDRAVERLGEALDDVPMVDEIVGRALRACV